MSDSKSVVELKLLGQQLKEIQVDLRAIKRDMAMLHAQQRELPTVAQFQAGLTALDARVTELAKETNGLIRQLAKQLDQGR